MFSSVRIRLTLWYTAAMAAILILLASVTYIVIQQNVRDRGDVQAVELADTFLSTVNAEIGESTKPDSLDYGVESAISEHRFPDVVFAVFDPESNLIGLSEWFPEDRHHSEWKRDSLLAPLKSALTNGKTYQSLHFAGRTYRLYVRRFSLAQQSATLVVVQSLFHQNEFLETLAGTFFVVIPITLLIAGAGGYLLARNSLAPVVAMSEQARLIGAENLDKRLSVTHPNDELGHLASSFNGLLDRLSASFDRQKRFVADASHELRTPVAILCGETEVALAKNDRTEQEYREALRILADESKRLKRIVEDLFTLARADAGQYPLSYSDFYLDELAGECVKNMRTLAAAKSITLACAPGGEALISADEALVRRMILNLLDNAIKYTPAGGTVSLNIADRDGVYDLKVTDSGPGIPTDLHARIFERFFRVDKARSRNEQDGGGAGLGLSIGSWIASAHNGKLELTSSGAQGSIFTAVLPKRPQSS
ncbi:MAG: HAMP domain-containing protein [Acidobacteria bacterium]|nr:HAMP domain-containing protein [Acidobacteriota bacterium]